MKTSTRLAIALLSGTALIASPAAFAGHPDADKDEGYKEAAHHEKADEDKDKEKDESTSEESSDEGDDEGGDDDEGDE